jgi:hypothetical protein
MPKEPKDRGTELQPRTAVPTWDSISPEPGVGVMPDSKAKVTEFCKLCVQVSIDYDLYISLFVADKSRIELYKSIAPFCFGDLSAILVQYVRLQFCKTTDKAKT